MNWFIVMSATVYTMAGFYSYKMGDPATKFWFFLLYIAYAVSCVALIMIERNK